MAGWIIADFENVYFERGRWHVLPQVGTGLITFIIGLGREVAHPRHTVMPLFEIGTLYTMVAGLLNILVVMETVLTSLRLRRKTS